MRKRSAAIVVTLVSAASYLLARGNLKGALLNFGKQALGSSVPGRKAAGKANSN